VAAARLGAEVFLIGRVGDEPRGHDLVDGLHLEGINTRFIGFEPNRTSGAAIISVDEDGEKQISAALGANLTLQPAHVREAEEVIAGASVLLMQFESPVKCVMEAARLARRHGVKVVLDPAPPTNFPKELLKLVFAIRPNSDEAEHLTGVKVKDRPSARKAALALLRKGAQVAAVQAGQAGDLIVSADEEFLVPRLNVKSLDATGAGDAFAAGLAVAIAENMPLHEAARFANVTAALSTTQFGAQAGMPSRKEVDRRLARR
jgi:ribokinase